MTNTMIEYYGLQRVVSRAWQGPTPCTDLHIILTVVKATTSRTSLWREVDWLLAVARHREVRF